jgi:hypothetical protein
MRRRPIPRVQLLDFRHPGLQEKVQTMFDESWPTADVRQILYAHYGERVSLSCLEKYRREMGRSRQAGADRVIEST